jgi:hypothetical protein
MGVPIVWWRKPYGGMDGHGTSLRERCEGSPESSEVSSLGKLSVFSKSPIGTFGPSIHKALERSASKILPGIDLSVLFMLFSIWMSAEKTGKISSIFTNKSGQ